MSCPCVHALIHSDVSVCWMAYDEIERWSSPNAAEPQSLRRFLLIHALTFAHAAKHTPSLLDLSAHEIIITPRNAPATRGRCEMFWLTRDTEREVLPNPPPAVPVAKSKTLRFVYAVEVQTVFRKWTHTAWAVIQGLSRTQSYSHTQTHIFFMSTGNALTFAPKKCWLTQNTLPHSHKFTLKWNALRVTITLLHSNKMLLHLHKTFICWSRKTTLDPRNVFTFSQNALECTQSVLTFTQNALAFAYTGFPFAVDAHIHITRLHDHRQHFSGHSVR